jgi:hypothetical protein
MSKKIAPPATLVSSESAVYRTNLERCTLPDGFIFSCGISSRDQNGIGFRYRIEFFILRRALTRMNKISEQCVN